MRFHKWFFNKKLAVWNWGFWVKLSEYKGLEVEFSANGPSYFNLGFSYWWKAKGKMDHHGLDLEFNLGWWELGIRFSDSRHVEHITGDKNDL